MLPIIGDTGTQQVAKPYHRPENNAPDGDQRCKCQCRGDQDHQAGNPKDEGLDFCINLGGIDAQGYRPALHDPVDRPMRLDPSAIVTSCGKDGSRLVRIGADRKADPHQLAATGDGFSIFRHDLHTDDQIGTQHDRHNPAGRDIGSWNL